LRINQKSKRQEIAIYFAKCLLCGISPEKAAARADVAGADVAGAPADVAGPPSTDWRGVRKSTSRGRSSGGSRAVKKLRIAARAEPGAPLPPRRPLRFLISGQSRRTNTAISPVTIRNGKWTAPFAKDTSLVICALIIRTCLPIE